MATKKQVTLHTAQRGLWGDCVYTNGTKYEIDDNGFCDVDNVEDAKRLCAGGFRVGNRKNGQAQVVAPTKATPATAPAKSAAPTKAAPAKPKKTLKERILGGEEE